MRLWLVFGAAAVVGKAAFYGLQKRGLDERSPVSMALASTVVGGPVLGALALHGFVTDPGAVSADLTTAAVVGTLEVGSFLLGLFVLARVDLSLLTPLKQTKPVVVALAEPVVLAAAFDPAVGGAAAVAAIGGVVTTYDGTGPGLISPSRRDLGLIALVVGASATLSLAVRFGTTRIPVLRFGGVVYAVLFAAYLGLFVGRRTLFGDDGAGVLGASRGLLDPVIVGVAVLGPARSIAVWLAYRTAPSAASVTVVTQLTIVLQVVVGGVALGEENTRYRLAGGALIVSGVVLLVLL